MAGTDAPPGDAGTSPGQRSALLRQSAGCSSADRAAKPGRSVPSAASPFSPRPARALQGSY